MATAKRPPGRPSVYTDSLAGKICSRLANGESLRAICRDEVMPDVGTVLDWVVQDRGGFASKYARAREAQAEGNAAEIVEIADTDPDPQRAKVRIDARKWTAEKLMPKRYGDKLDLTSAGDKLTAQVVVMVPDNARGDRSDD